MESKSKEPLKKVMKNVYIGRNPVTGKPYFEKRAVDNSIPDLNISPEEPIEKSQFQKVAEKFEEAGRPMGGAKDD